MARTQLIPAASGGDKPTTPVAVQRPAGIPLDTSEVNDVVAGSIDTVRQEVDDAFADMRTFHSREPDEIMRMCGGHSARLSELRVRVMRVEDYRREWRSVRTRELEPAIEELKQQYAIASRLHSVRQLDWAMESGQQL